MDQRVHQDRQAGEHSFEYESTNLETPKYNKNISYYEQFWKTYLINEMIILKAKELTTKNK